MKKLRIKLGDFATVPDFEIKRRWRKPVIKADLSCDLCSEYYPHRHFLEKDTERDGVRLCMRCAAGRRSPFTSWRTDMNYNDLSWFSRAYAVLQALETEVGVVRASQHAR